MFEKKDGKEVYYGKKVDIYTALRKEDAVTNSGGKPSSAKVKYAGRVYVVRTEQRRKFIRVKGTTTWLADIKGKYKKVWFWSYTRCHGWRSLLVCFVTINPNWVENDYLEYYKQYISLLPDKRIQNILVTGYNYLIYVKQTRTSGGKHSQKKRTTKKRSSVK